MSPVADDEIVPASREGTGTDDTATGTLDVELELDLTGERKGLGAYYTPPDVVDGLLRLTLDPILAELESAGPSAVERVRVLDPTCGSGNFLVAVLERVMDSLQRCGVALAEVGLRALNCVAGIDLDERAATVCRQRLADRAGAASPETCRKQIRVADSLLMPHESPLTLFVEDQLLDWDSFRSEIGAEDGFDLVVGNPPFLSQLHADTAFDKGYSASLKDRFGDLLATYTDPASLFLVVGADLLKPLGGRLCLIEPLSVLASRGAANVRTALSRASLTDAWFAEKQVFDDAAVEVWAPIFEAGATSRQTTVRVGPQMTEIGIVTLSDDDQGSWSPLLAAVRGVPDGDWRSEGTLADIATATADFRDQYYGLAGSVVDERDREDLPRLVTAGLIDPGRLLWGDRPTRFNKVTFQAPRVDVETLDEELRAWAKARLVPKVLVATQTRVLEAIVDDSGELVPSVPVLTVESERENLWKIAALLSSPPVAAIAARRHLGSALSADALKLSASEILALPLPRIQERWTRAGELFRQASGSGEPTRTELLEASAAEMCAAYGIEEVDGLLEWWRRRTPNRTGEAVHT